MYESLQHMQEQIGGSSGSSNNGHVRKNEVGSSGNVSGGGFSSRDAVPPPIGQSALGTADARERAINEVGNEAPPIAVVLKRKEVILKPPAHKR